MRVYASLIQNSLCGGVKPWLTASVLQETRIQIENVLIKAGVKNVLLIDEAGNIVVTCGHTTDDMDTTSLAALAAANFGATSQIAKLIGEDDFALLFSNNFR